MEAVMRIDGNLHAELNADIQKELNLELNRAKSQKSKDSDLAKVTICNVGVFYGLLEGVRGWRIVGVVGVRHRVSVWFCSASEIMIESRVQWNVQFILVMAVTTIASY